MYHSPWYLGVDMETARVTNKRIDSLQAFWSGMQTLGGDLQGAIRSHAAFAAVRQKCAARLF